MYSNPIPRYSEAITWNESLSDKLNNYHLSTTQSRGITFSDRTRYKTHKLSISINTDSLLKRKHKRQRSDTNYDLPSYNKLNNEDFIENNFYEQRSCSSSSSEINSEFVSIWSPNTSNEDSVIKLKNDLLPNNKMRFFEEKTK